MRTVATSTTEEILAFVRNAHRLGEEFTFTCLFSNNSFMRNSWCYANHYNRPHCCPALTGKQRWLVRRQIRRRNRRRRLRVNRLYRKLLAARLRHQRA